MEEITVFEQVIDPDQIHMEANRLGALFMLSPLIAILILLIPLFFFGIPGFLQSPKKRRWLPSLVDYSPILLLYGLFFTTLLLYLSAPMPIKGLNQPVFTEQMHLPRLSFKETVYDVYHKDIKQAVDEKLKDYKVPEYTIDNPQNSILHGGKYLERIAAVKDGNTYTLTPQVDYEKDTKTVKLSVKISKGYHLEK